MEARTHINPRLHLTKYNNNAKYEMYAWKIVWVVGILGVTFCLSSNPYSYYHNKKPDITQVSLFLAYNGHVTSYCIF